MPDELRDMLRNRADAVDVPGGDVSTVVSGGRALKARRYAFAAVAGVVVTALIAWGATTETQLFDRGTGEVADPGPTESSSPEPTESVRHVVGACEEVSFRPGYLPEGWDYVLGEGSGGERGLPPEDRVWPALGHWASRGAADAGGPVPGFIDIFEYDSAPYPNISHPEPVEVLGSEGTIGDVHEGYGVDFMVEGCRFMLNANGPPKNELRQVAEQLKPTEQCDGDVAGFTSKDRLPDGRHFGSIRSTSGIAVRFEPAEFLTGEAANEAAREDGVIGPGETVPNDYYINDDDAPSVNLPVSMDAEVLLETFREDGNVGLARWELGAFVCMFVSDESLDQSHTQAPFWIEVERGIVTLIEEQYVP
jgi:hypothetical protein